MVNVDGVRFLVVGSDQAALVKTTGLYALARRDGRDQCTILYVDSADCAGPDAQRSPAWRAAARLGMNEMLFTLGVRERELLTRMKAQVIAAARPPLNVQASSEGGVADRLARAAEFAARNISAA